MGQVGRGLVGHRETAGLWPKNCDELLWVFSWRATPATSLVMHPSGPGAQASSCHGGHVQGVFAEKDACHSNRRRSGHSQPPPEPSCPLGGKAACLLCHWSLQNMPTAQTPPGTFACHPSFPHPTRMFCLFPIPSHTHQSLLGVTHPPPSMKPSQATCLWTDCRDERTNGFDTDVTSPPAASRSPALWRCFLQPCDPPILPVSTTIPFDW